VAEGQEVCFYGSLAKFTESPLYRNPSSKQEGPAMQSLDLPDSSEVQLSSFDLRGEFGPAYFKELLWVGQITAFMEM
jgi:hypothetical protein